LTKIASNQLHIELQRNERKLIELAVTDRSGAVIDLTNATITCPVGLAPGLGTILMNWDVTLVEPSAGRLIVELDGITLDPLVAGDQDQISLVYNLVAVQSGQQLVLLRGTIFLNPGVPS